MIKAHICENSVYTRHIWARYSIWVQASEALLVHRKTRMHEQVDSVGPWCAVVLGIHRAARRCVPACTQRPTAGRTARLLVASPSPPSACSAPGTAQSRPLLSTTASPAPPPRPPAVTSSFTRWHGNETVSFANSDVYQDDGAHNNGSSRESNCFSVHRQSVNRKYSCWNFLGCTDFWKTYDVLIESCLAYSTAQMQYICPMHDRGKEHEKRERPKEVEEDNRNRFMDTRADSPPASVCRNSHVCLQTPQQNCLSLSQHTQHKSTAVMPTAAA